MSKSKDDQHAYVSRRIRTQIGELRAERHLGLSIIHMEMLFDETAKDNLERRRAIADCMGKRLSTANEEAQARTESQTRAE
jgi:hypothetical protein